MKSETASVSLTPPAPKRSAAWKATLILIPIVTAGALLSTVTVTTTDVVLLPAASRATAANVCDPLVAVAVSHGTANGADVSSAPSGAPSRRNCTPTTPVLSEAFAVTVIAPRSAVPAMGAVTKTGQIDFPKPEPSLMDGLATVGGLANNLAHNTGVFVFRLEEPHAWQDANGNWQPGPVIFKFDMSRPETFFFEQVFALKADDTIYVTNAPTVEWLRLIVPIAQTMATVRGGITLQSSFE